MKPDPEQFLQTLCDSGILSPDDISIYDRVLSEAEIKAMAAGKN